MGICICRATTIPLILTDSKSAKGSGKSHLESLMVSGECRNGHGLRKHAVFFVYLLMCLKVQCICIGMSVYYVYVYAYALCLGP